jgi:hypothetical protein
LGVPFFEGTTGNAEIFVALFAALGVYATVVHKRPVSGGISLSIAILFKAVAVFDATALGLWILRERRRDFWLYAAATVSILLLLVIVTSWCGILPSMFKDAFVYDVGYVGYANGGSIPWLLCLKVGCVVGLTFLLRRAPFPYLWLVYAVIGALFSGRFNGHYGVQVIAPVSLALAHLFQRRKILGRRALIGLPSLVFVSVIAASALGWTLAATGHNSLVARQFQWYSNFARFALRQESYAVYRGQIDSHIDRNLRLVAAVAGLPPGKILVWGNAPWLYVLSGRLPATPFTTALWQPEVPGESAVLRAAVRDGMPIALVVISSPSPPLGAAESALASLYRPVVTVGNSEVYASIR